MASRLIVILAIVVILLIGFVLIADPFGNENADADMTAVRATAAQGI
jgi:preprotein translocase subunit SecG